MRSTLVVALILAASVHAADDVVTRRISDAELQFSQSLFSALANEQPDGNLAVAPFSVFESLAMLDVGADGDTSDQIRHVTGLSPSGKTTAQLLMTVRRSGRRLIARFDATVSDNNRYGVQISDLPSDDSHAGRAGLAKNDLIFSVDGTPVRSTQEFDRLIQTAEDTARLTGYDWSSGRVFADREVAIGRTRAAADDPGSRQLAFASVLCLRDDIAKSSLYPMMLHDLFRTPTVSLDLRDQASFRAAVGESLRNQAGARLDDVRLPDDLAPDTALLLVTALAMDADWQRRFPKSATKAAAFELDDESQMSVDYLRQRDVFRYAQMNGVQVVELPYRESSLVMRLYLADDRAEQNEFERTGFLNPVDSQRLTELLRPSQVDIALPRFRIDFDGSLRSALTNLELAGLFTHEADFGGISKSVSVRLEDMLQTSFVEINEDGTKAGAVTSSVGIPKSVESDRIVRFHATHCFHFEIRNTSGIVFFAGRVARPLPSKP